MNSANINVGGEIVRELSEKVPTHIFALNELIKNAYDACASHVTITISTSKSSVTVSDDGEGMSRTDIDTLFHLAKSTKTYGTTRTCGATTRYIQGSKGLGFLSVFKFGRHVKWQTCNGKTELKFSVNYNDVTSVEKITDYNIPIKEQKGAARGTTIEIKADPKDLSFLVEYLSDGKNNQKVIGAFLDENFTINLKVDNGVNISTSDIAKPENILKDRQSFYVKYDSKSEKLEFYHLGKVIKTLNYKCVTEKTLVSLSVIIFNLAPNSKLKIPKYFWRESDDQLSPLVFINDNLFHNERLFDPGIFRSRRTSDSMPQMIGYVKIQSSRKDLEFSADRTRILETDFKRAIDSDLKSLNELIQPTAAKLRREAKEDSKKDELGPAHPDFATPSTTNENPTDKSEITLKEPNFKYPIPQKKFNARQLVKNACDAHGNSIDRNNLGVEVNGEELSDPNLDSITESCRKTLYFYIRKPNKGSASRFCTVEFYQPMSSITGGEVELSLFSVPQNSGYKISHPTISRILNQIDCAHRSPDRYYEIIAPALRTVFEISCKALEYKYPIIFKNKIPKLDKVLWRVACLLAFVLSDVNANRKILTEISKVVKLDYSTLQNILKTQSFTKAVKGAHLGAHGSTEYLTEETIRTIASAAGYIALTADAIEHHVSGALINNANPPTAEEIQYQAETR
ncbi:ATP-binding protein [Salinisphaera orenii]|uniref:ATP-binding protein n=1 Tax=Salinisphaera orenii TaxID=856731 RepID=UPI000F4D0CCD|nr:ATP-binding protein [Salinisphaera orenii]